MPSKRTQLGNRGEAIAIDYLEAEGYTIIETQWRCKRGEIDIIAEQGAMLVFVEVKTRRASSTDEVFANITPAKRKKLIASAHIYVSRHERDDLWRIDAIGIALRDDGPPLVDHVEDALDW